MCEEKSKMLIVEENLQYIRAINKVLADAIRYNEIYGLGDFIPLLTIQYDYIRNINNLF